MKNFGVNLSTNPDVGIYQHSGMANGFFYYAKWSFRHFDEFGYAKKDLNFFWIVNEYGDLVPQPDYPHLGFGDGQFDLELLANYGKTLGADSKNVNFDFILEQTEETGRDIVVLMDFRLVGYITKCKYPYSKNEYHRFINECICTIQWENGTTSDIPINQFEMNNIYFLV